VLSSPVMKNLLFRVLLLFPLAIPLGLSGPARAEDHSEKKPATPASSAPQEEQDDVEDSPLTKVPPGSAEDQALWRSALDINNAVSIAWSAVTRLQAGLQTDRVLERLRAATRTGSPEDMEAAGKVLLRLEAAWGLSAEYMRRGRLVDQTRACGYPLLTFATAMPDTKTEEDRKALASARVELKVCESKAQEMVEGLASVYRPLVAASAEAEGVLRRAAAPAPASAGPR